MFVIVWTTFGTFPLIKFVEAAAAGKRIRVWDINLCIDALGQEPDPKPASEVTTFN